MTARSHTLSCGARVVCDPSREHETFALSLMIDGGARYEDEAHAGWSHLLEHMAFKGAGGRDARRIVEDIEDAGGSINAATGHERTSYQVRALRGGVPLAVEVVADLVLRPTLDAEELEREKGVIAQEIAEADDTPDDRVFEIAHDCAYPDHPLGRPILGTTKSLAGATSAAVAAWRARLYAPERIVICASGAVDEDELLAAVERAFAGVQAGDAGAPPLTAAFGGGAVAEARRLEQAHLVLLLPGAAVHDSDETAGRVFAEALGGGMSSRLFQEARERLGLAYAIDAYVESYVDTGLLGVYAGAAAADLAPLAEVVARELRDLTERPRPAEVARARVQLKSSLFMARESLMARAEQAAAQTLVYGRLLSPAEVAARIDAVDEAAVRRFGERLLSPGRSATAVLGPKRAGAAADAFGRALAN